MFWNRSRRLKCPRWCRLGPDRSSWIRYGGVGHGAAHVSERSDNIQEGGASRRSGNAVTLLRPDVAPSERPAAAAAASARLLLWAVLV